MQRRQLCAHRGDCYVRLSGIEFHSATFYRCHLMGVRSDFCYRDRPHHSLASEIWQTQDERSRLSNSEASKEPGSSFVAYRDSSWILDPAIDYHNRIRLPAPMISSRRRAFEKKENPLRSPFRNGFLFSRLLTLVLGRLRLLGTHPRSPLRWQVPIAPTTARLPIPLRSPYVCGRQRESLVEDDAKLGARLHHRFVTL